MYLAIALAILSMIILVVSVVLNRRQTQYRGWVMVLGLYLTVIAAVQTYIAFGWTNQLPMRAWGNLLFLIVELPMAAWYLWLLATLTRKYVRLHLKWPRIA